MIHKILHHAKVWSTKHVNEFLWVVALVLGLLSFYLLMANYAKAVDNLNATKSTVVHMDHQLDELQTNITNDHHKIAAEQQRIRLCLINLFTDGQVVTKNQVSECVKPARAPVPQETSPSSQSSSSPSSSNNSATHHSSQPDNSHANSPDPPSEFRCRLPIVGIIMKTFGECE